MSQRLRSLIPALALGLGAFVPAAFAAAPPVAETLYTGGTILTMAGDTPRTVEALGVAGGRIVHAGPLRSAPRSTAMKVVNLQGRTLLPGFIDTHGHFIYFGKNLVDADLFGATSVAEIVARMKEQAKKVRAGEWIVGFGFSGNSLARYPSVAELDAVSAEVPVMVVDSSGHGGAFNSAAFRAAGISAASPDPEGGKFERGPDGRSLAGKAEETALNLVREKRPPFTGAPADTVATGASRLWASYGRDDQGGAHNLPPRCRAGCGAAAGPGRLAALAA
ncbi:MAG: amidohydrolase family protein [Cyanobium sp.]